MASIKNKNSLRIFFLVSVFLVTLTLGLGSVAEPVAAAAFGAQAGNAAAIEAGIKNADNVPDGSDNFVVQAFKWLLYGMLFILIKFVQVGASVFAWATRPEYISGPTGLLNLESVYFLWGFIRDFFNLFFIFLLLFAAFATIFQIEQYGIKKNFLKIILAALAINFSFPLTRIIIDMGNVPMYFFADGLVNSAGGGNALLSIPNALWKSTTMGDILALPNPNESGTLSALIGAVIFAFIFMITLFVLAMLFVLRLLKLVILLIFSPLGVAASLVPGLEKMGKDWWSQLFKTVFFGPAAMLMIVVALRFSWEINGGAAQGGTGFTQGLGGTAPAASRESQSSIISQGVFFIPIILMWMAMHVGNKFGIEGSKLVMEKADKFANWGKKQALRPVYATGRGIKKAAKDNAVSTRVRGGYQGLKKGLYEGRVFGKNYGDSKLGALVTPKKYKERGEDAEAAWRGRFNKGGKGVLAEQKKVENRRIQEKMKEFKDDLLERSDLESKLLDEKSSEVEKKAAALSLAETKEGITKKPEVLAASLALFKDDPDKYDKVRTSTDDDAWGMSDEQYDATRLVGVRANVKKAGSPENKDVAQEVNQLMSQEDAILENTIKTQAEPLYANTKATIDNLIAQGMKPNDAQEQVLQGLSAQDQALYHIGEMNNKTIVDFGKQIKKTGGDIDRLFEYQTGRTFSTGAPQSQQITYNDIEALYKQHKFTMKDLSQQSTLLKNQELQNYAIANWTPSMVTELEKAMSGNKDTNAHKAVKAIRDGISAGTNQPNQQQGAGQAGGTNQQSPGQQWQQNQAQRNARAQQARNNKSRPIGNP